jgi:hypothetical protein
MPRRTVPQTIDLAIAPELVLKTIAGPRRIPAGALAFADSFERIGNRWTAIKGDRRFPIRISLDSSTGCFDILRDIAPREEGGFFYAHSAQTRRRKAS